MKAKVIQELMMQQDPPVLPNSSGSWGAAGNGRMRYYPTKNNISLETSIVNAMGN